MRVYNVLRIRHRIEITQLGSVLLILYIDLFIGVRDELYYSSYDIIIIHIAIDPVPKNIPACHCDHIKDLLDPLFSFTFARSQV